jgi:hypothetical protein
MNETTPVERWAALLPRATLLTSDPGTVLPIREINAILRRSCPRWAYTEVLAGGHMAAHAPGRGQSACQLVSEGVKNRRQRSPSNLQLASFTACGIRSGRKFSGDKVAVVADDDARAKMIRGQQARSPLLYSTTR